MVQFLGTCFFVANHLWNQHFTMTTRREGKKIKTSKKTMITWLSFCAFGNWAHKSWSSNFGEIDPCSQFHQHLTSSFCADILAPKNYKAKLKSEKSFAKSFCMKKVSIKCWWNWHLWLISSTFYVQLLRESQVVSIFMLSGSTSVKAEPKCVGEIDTRSPKKYSSNCLLSNATMILTKYNSEKLICT